MLFQIILSVLKLMKNTFEVTQMNVHIIYDIIELIQNEYHG